MIGLHVFSVIGQSGYLGFGFTTCKEKLKEGGLLRVLRPGGLRDIKGH